MNYYEHHIGDYIKATAHLSMLEDAAYRRLIDAYYTRELPLPVEKKACHRLARAFSKPEKEAVDTVLEEFFSLDADGWHQKRCDQEIEKYSEKRPAADEKKENDRERQKRARERRKSLFEALSGLGVNMPWNATTEQLQAELSRFESHDKQPPVTEPVTEPVTRDNTATHTPVPTPHSPVVNPTSKSVLCTQPELRDQPATGTRKGKVCGLLRQAGMSDAAPHYLDDATWERILGKRTDEEIVELAKAKMAARPGQRTGLKYIAPALLEDPQAIAISGQKPRQTIHDQREAVSIALTGRKPTHERQIADPERDITGESVRVA